MGKFHVVYFGTNYVPAELIKPILAEIDADLTIRRPSTEDRRQIPGAARFPGRTHPGFRSRK